VQWYWARIAEPSVPFESRTVASILVTLADWASLAVAGRTVVSIMLGWWHRAIEESRHARNKSLAALAAMSAVIGLGWIWFVPPTVDSGETMHWWPIVTNLVAGLGYSDCPRDFFPFCTAANQVTASREPLPILVFWGVARLSNGSLYAVSFLELLLHVLVGIGIYRAGRLVGNVRTGIIATLLWVLYFPAYEWIPQASGELPATLAMTWAAALFLRARATESSRDSAVAAILVGAGTLCRMAVLPAGAALALTVQWPGLRRRINSDVSRRRARSLAIVAALVVAVLLPWIIRNQIALGRPILGTTLSGYNLYRYNHILATDDYLRFVDWKEAANEFRRLVERRTDLTGTENEAQMEAVYRTEALAVIREHPGRYLALSAYRFLMLWFDWTVNRAYGLVDGTWSYSVAVLHAGLLAAALAGIRLRGLAGQPLGAAVTALSLAYMAVCAHVRFLMPVIPLVLVLAAAGLERILDARVAVAEREPT
jgi:hypothetical protein